MKTMHELVEELEATLAMLATELPGVARQLEHGAPPAIAAEVLDKLAAVAVEAVEGTRRARNEFREGVERGG